ncbi:MAG: hypothetical protein FWB77_04570 [Treponema sp.]|nr:hypothetical protein [Treponema sp.]
MPTPIKLLAVMLLVPCLSLQAETFRTSVEGNIEVSLNSTEMNIPIGIHSSVIITLGADARFLRGIEIEITAPQNWLPYRGSLLMAMYNNLNVQTAAGVSDIEGTRIAMDPLPSRLRILYHIPIRTQHGLRTTTAVIVAPTSAVQPASFPLLFRLTQASKGLPDEFEGIMFSLTARPILSDEGAVRLIPRYPPQLRNRPFTVLIDDNVISNISDQIMLREGEHHLVILSDDYRNESRRFVVERSRIIDLTIELQDPTPLIIFEGPQNSQVFLNNNPVSRNKEPIAVEPGTHEVRYQVGDYTIIRSLNVQRGKTYRVALAVDLTVQEED